MLLDTIRTATLSIPFRSTFRHASAERSQAQTLWAEARSSDGTTGYGEGCPREYVTAESLRSAREFAAGHASSLCGAVSDLASLAGWVAAHEAVIDRNPAAWTAMELAMLDLLGKVNGRTVEELLGEPALQGRFHYSAVLGDAAPAEFAAQLEKYLRAGFRDFKIKLSGDAARDRAKVRALADSGIASESVRADANNLWSDAAAAVSSLRALDYPFFALEEPLRSGDYAGMREIVSALGVNIILDESLLRLDQVERLEAFAGSAIVNLRVSKMGGLLRSLGLVRELRRRGVGVIVGAHVGETSVLTRTALTVANSARDILVAQEGAFGTHLLAWDVVDPPVMFGPGGIVDAATAGIAGPGFGLAVTAPAVTS
ncbi:MAG: hypothetical protein KIT18_15945 [Burkholderiales bacterium]|nr:hypothetical protein [Burkholderiales bacterium]